MHVSRKGRGRGFDITDILVCPPVEQACNRARPGCTGDRPELQRQSGDDFEATAIMARHSLFKYYNERRWADEFLDGKLLFRSLSYFRDVEDKNVREDQNEGNAVFRPEGGLVINNETRGTTLTLPGYAFESRVKQHENLCILHEQVTYRRASKKVWRSYLHRDYGSGSILLQNRSGNAARSEVSPPSGETPRPDWATGRILPRGRRWQPTVGAT